MNLAQTALDLTPVVGLKSRFAPSNDQPSARDALLPDASGTGAHEAMFLPGRSAQEAAGQAQELSSHKVDSNASSPTQGIAEMLSPVGAPADAGADMTLMLDPTIVVGQASYEGLKAVPESLKDSPPPRSESRDSPVGKQAAGADAPAAAAGAEACKDLASPLPRAEACKDLASPLPRAGGAEDATGDLADMCINFKQFDMQLASSDKEAPSSSVSSAAQAQATSPGQQGSTADSAAAVAAPVGTQSASIEAAAHPPADEAAAATEAGAKEDTDMADAEAEDAAAPASVAGGATATAADDCNTSISRSTSADAEPAACVSPVVSPVRRSVAGRIDVRRCSDGPRI